MARSSRRTPTDPVGCDGRRCCRSRRGPRSATRAAIVQTISACPRFRRVRVDHDPIDPRSLPRDAPGGRADDLSGCGAGNGLNLARVSGKVMYKGQPVKNGTVFFMPDESKGTVGPPAVGSITSDGTYIMSTESAGDGVIVGQHKVGITGRRAGRRLRRGGVRPREGRRRLHEGQVQGGRQAARGRHQEGRGFVHRQGRQEIPLCRPDEVLEAG